MGLIAAQRGDSVMRLGRRLAAASAAARELECLRDVRPFYKGVQTRAAEQCAVFTAAMTFVISGCALPFRGAQAFLARGKVLRLQTPIPTRPSIQTDCLSPTRSSRLPFC